MSCTRVSLQQQQLLFNGKEIKNAEYVHVSANELSLNPDGSAVNPAAFQRHLRQNGDMITQLLQTDPALAQAILGDDLENLQNILRDHHRQRLELRHRQEEELALMYADPFDVESQKKIEAAIKQVSAHLISLSGVVLPKGIDENWATALEYNPEAFARVVMLYVDMEVNGVPIKNPSVNDQLSRLLDERFKGIAMGVGQSEILGRIHVAPIKVISLTVIGNVFYQCSFTVLDSPNMEFLFGLDMLRKHQCMIDLKENVLRVGGGEVSVPFLQEKDLPSRLLDEERYTKQASLGQGSAPGSDFEAKVKKLVELGFSREQVIQALKLFNGNEEQAAGYLFGVHVGQHVLVSSLLICRQEKKTPAMNDASRHAQFVFSKTEVDRLAVACFSIGGFAHSDIPLRRCCFVGKMRLQLH
ncbi:hypothetical protein ACLOJK_041605 [Asimina triloba]